MGHSLANNNQVMVQLIDGEFDEVYGVNGAQISVDHLLATDLDLRDRLMHKFHIRRLKDINDIPPEKLKKEIQKYYEDKGVTANIATHLKRRPAVRSQRQGRFHYIR